ncbi:MAG TPA: hypothetical protein VG939_14890 [Caulobacteraceae bacterium]|nr:hypothetical protein [Caulobacteraceae bacterium]
MALGAFALVAIASGAHAQQARPRSTADAFASQSPATGPTTPHRTLQWDAKKGRWGFSLDMNQHTDRDLQWKDVAPGFYYRATPNLRVGAGVSLSEDTIEGARKIEPQQPAPRVRLETTFKF